MITLESATGELHVATTLHAARLFLAYMLEGDREFRLGYQVGPEVDTAELLGALGNTMRAQVDPAFDFDEIHESSTRAGKATTAHVDTMGRQHRGIAVNENLTGTGKLAMQSVRFGDPHLHPFTPDRMVGPCLRGVLLPGMKTVYSEGIESAQGEIQIGATLHYFETDQGSPERHWRRFSYAG